MASQLTIDRIKNVLCVAELGRQTINYDHIDVMGDGPNGIKQITLSIGFTQFGGDLKKVVDEYIHRSGKYAGELLEYVASFQKLDLYSNQNFLQLLKLAGREDPIMASVQEDLFESIYIGPGVRWAESEGLLTPFSALIICDSFLQSGSIIPRIRSLFAEVTPKNGGDEKAWTLAYLQARNTWLKDSSNSLVRTSAYRTAYYLKLAALNDWDLNLVGSVAMNGVFPLSIKADSKGYETVPIKKITLPIASTSVGTIESVRVVTLDMIYDKMLDIEAQHKLLLMELSTMIRPISANPSK